MLKTTTVKTFCTPLLWKDITVEMEPFFLSAKNFWSDYKVVIRNLVPNNWNSRHLKDLPDYFKGHNNYVRKHIHVYT